MRRVVAVASVTEDAAAINESHNAVLGKTLFAVDAPDGEHDMEDVVSQESAIRTVWRCNCITNCVRVVYSM